MIRILSTLAILLFLCSTAISQVRLNEVLFDPYGPDSGYEWVELYNTSASPVDISNYSIGWGTDGYSEGYDFPPGTVIAAHDYLLLGGPSSDTINHFPCYDLVQNFDTLPNGAFMGFGVPSGIALFDIPFASVLPGPFGTVPIDAVIYNGTTNSNGLLDERGNSGPNNVDVIFADEGESLLRTGDTTWAVSTLPDPQGGGLNPCGCIGFQEGDACDDGDPLTVNDTLDANCNCAGISNCLVYPCGGIRLTDNIAVNDNQPVTDGRYITWVSESVFDVPDQFFGVYLFDTENPQAGINTIKLDIQEKYVPDVKDGYVVWEEKNDTATNFWYYDILQDTAIHFASHPVSLPGNHFPKTCQGQIVWAMGDSAMHYDIQNPVFNGTTLTNAGSLNNINGLTPVTNGRHIAWRELTISGTIKGHVFLYDLQNPVYGGSQITNSETNIIDLQFSDSLLVWNSSSGLNFDAEVYLYDLENTGLGVQQITNNTDILDGDVHTDGNNLVWARGPFGSREQVVFYNYATSGPQDTLFEDTLSSVNNPKVQGERVAWFNSGQLLFFDRANPQLGIQKLANHPYFADQTLSFSEDVLVWVDTLGSGFSEIFYYHLPDSLTDQDGDGFCSLWDCDDNDASFYPGASCVDSICGATGVIDSNCLCQVDTLPYDECSGAWVLNLNDTISVCNTYATASTDFYPPSGCFAGTFAGGDVWLTFDAPACTGTFDLEIGISDSDLDRTNMLLYSGSCGNLNFIDCERTSSGDTSAVLFNLTGIPCGDSTYFLRIFDSQNDDVGTVEVFVNTDACGHPDFPALKALYQSTGGPNWTENTGWDTTGTAGCDPCSWYGIACNGDGRVRFIELDSNNLVGSIPEEIDGLTALELFFVQDNQLSGSLPSSFANLSELKYLKLHINQFSGPFPMEVTQLDSLRTLWLQQNQFTDTLPAELSNLSKLDYLSVAFNQFSGPIPPEIGDLSDLRYLYLHGNQLTGSLPTEIGNLSKLEYFWCQANQLSGILPLELGKLEQMLFLDLSDNDFTGPIPDTLGSLDLMVDLRMRNNMLQGPIPGVLGELPLLNSLFLNGNQLQGCYDHRLANLCNQLDTLFSTNFYISDGNNLDTTWEAFCASGVGVCPCPHPDVAALRALYQSTNGPNWTNNSGWADNTNCDPCSWFGVTCDASGRVKEINLFGNGLSGALPQELGQLDSLNTLRLINDTLSGSIPPGLGSLPNLAFLELQNNQLTGAIPPELGNLTDLFELNLSNNLLSDSIPPELGNLSNLSQLRLDNNNLTGGLPPELGQLDNIGIISVHDNNLSGCYPVELDTLCIFLENNESSNNELISDGNNFDAPWEEFCSTLAGVCDTSTVCQHPDFEALIALYDSTGGPNWTDNTGWVDGKAGTDCDPCSWHGVLCNGDDRVIRLSLGVNNLTGALPDELSGLTALEELFLFTNNLSGGIPSSLDALPLRSIRLQINNLSGSIPASLGNISTLENLELGSNQLSGALPSSLGNLSNLENLSLFSNQLSGPIPQTFGNLGELKSLNLNGNSLQDTLPHSLGNLSNLEVLVINGNNLSGPIPNSFGQLTNLVDLNLASNQLIGTLPDTISALSNLKELQLFSNQLTGSIPEKWGQLLQLEDLLLQNNQLSGEIPATFGNLVSLEDLALFSNNLSGCYAPELNVLCSQLGANGTNARISDGNNFDAPWEDFCASGAGECACHPDVPALLALYDSTGGPNWTNNTGWVDGKAGTDCDPCSWHGVNCDGNGRVFALILINNNLVGTIPSMLDSLSHLTSLTFANNQLSGEIPPELGNLGNLTILNFSNNQLSGSLPTELGNLGNLGTLAIAANQLSGSIPTQLGDLTNLTNLTLNNNQLSGSIPVELGNLLNLQFLQLYNNQLSGPLPPELGNLSALLQFRLSGNQLTGGIPPEYGNLTNLTLFWLNDNQLSGCFPPELYALCGVNSVALQNNPGLPGGGNFVSFCDTGAGECPPPGCPDTLLLLSMHNADSTYKAADTITSTATIPPLFDITYQAGKEVRLLPDFHAKPGSNFLAKIDTCGVPPAASVLSSWGSREQEVEAPLPPPVSTQELSLQVFPNPARQRSTLQYYLPVEGRVQLEVYDLTGRPLQFLQDGFVPAGLHRIDWLLPSSFEGLYLVRLRTSAGSVVRRVMVVK